MMIVTSGIASTHLVPADPYPERTASCSELA
jgi:hypothetical protein